MQSISAVECRPNARIREELREERGLVLIMLEAEKVGRWMKIPGIHSTGGMC
jgi:hypothetical protein